MSELDVVVAHLLVREGLVGLGDFNELLVEVLQSLVRTGLGLVGVMLQRELLIDGLDGLLIERLADAQNLIRVPDVDRSILGGRDEIAHEAEASPTESKSNEALDSALLLRLPTASCFDGFIFRECVVCILHKGCLGSSGFYIG